MKDFWINALGEYGHGDDVDGGSINVKEVAEANGLKWEPPYEVPEKWFKQAFDRQLYAACSTAEIALYRAWEHLQPLHDATWRFYASIDQNAVSLLLITEYQHDVGDTKFWYDLGFLATQHGAKVVEMWTNDEGRQVSIEWDVLGKPFTEVARLQINWAIRTAFLDERRVAVL